MDNINTSYALMNTFKVICSFGELELQHHIFKNPQT